MPRTCSLSSLSSRQNFKLETMSEETPCTREVKLLTAFPMEDDPHLTFRSLPTTIGNGCSACCEVIPDTEEPQVTRFWHKISTRFLCSSIVISILLVVLVFLLIWGKDYIRECLIWMDKQEEWIVCLVFILLYTAVSFPVTWGYILLNLACGYHFGIIIGVIVTAFSACVGIFVAHTIIRWYFVASVMTKVTKIEAFHTILTIIEGPHGFKLLVISRLTPIPFGLQNALFALSTVNTSIYILASAVGLLPTQIINVYLGTTVRSIESVLADDTTASKGYAFLAAQVILSLVLMVLILRKARQELKKTLEAELHTEIPVSLEQALPVTNPWKRRWLQFRNKPLKSNEIENKIVKFHGIETTNCMQKIENV